jgi:DNA ligase (NAD+)
VAFILANTYASLEKLFRTTKDDLTIIEGVGPVVAESVVNFFKQDENLQTVNNIIASGVQILWDDNKNEGSLKGKVFVITGTLENMARSEAKKIIEEAGGKVSSSVSRNTDYLVAGSSPGSKLKHAKDLGVEIIDESALRELMIAACP